MNTKKCSKCKEHKNKNCFGKSTNRYDGLCNYCKDCRKSFYNENKKEILKKRKKYRDNNKKLVREINKKSYKKDPCSYILSNIKRRCNNPKSKDYKWYGAKGIKCKISIDELRYLWNRDKAYLMKRANIDRIDSSGNYNIENCRFIEQTDNVKKAILERINAKQKRKQPER